LIELILLNKTAHLRLLESIAKRYDQANSIYRNIDTIKEFQGYNRGAKEIVAEFKRASSIVGNVPPIKEGYGQFCIRPNSQRMYYKPACINEEQLLNY
jgi:hypothetical protein